MLKNKYAILAGAVLAASPLVGNAVTITFSYDTVNGDNTVNGAPAVFTGTSASPTLDVPLGATILLGVDVTVTGDPNSTAAYHGVYDSATGNHHYIQPANLGIGSFSMGFNTSSPNIAAFDPADSGGVAINGDFSSVTEGGAIVGSNVQQGSVTGNNLISSSINTANTAGVAIVAYGATSPAELFNSLQIDATANGTSTITPTGDTQAFASQQTYVAYNSGGTSSTSKPVYKNVIPGSTDTIIGLPALTIVVGPTVGATTQPIISLISGSTPGSSYGSPDGTLTLTGKGSGSYNVATAQGFTAATTGSVAVTGFTPATDTEIYALKLTSNGVAISGTQIATVIADINGGTGNMAPVGVVASAVTGVYTTLFPGYEVLLTAAPGPGSSDELEFDFSSTGEQDSAVPGLVLTGVAAVPEPATAAGVVMGAAGLLLGRRKNRLTVA